MGDSTRVDVYPASTSVMDEREMTSGVIPLRHASLPGHIKLPRRYEKAAMGTNGIPLRVRKISIQGGHRALGDTLGDRLDDLTSAILWVKQELIMLRQHDILLKRQFFDIQHSIRSIQKSQLPTTSTTTAINGATSSATSTTAKASITTTADPSTTTKHPLQNGDVHILEEPPTINGHMEEVSEVLQETRIDEFFMDSYVTVRPSSSVTLLHEVTSEEEGGDGEEGDTFCEDLFYRPRTSSMRTSRDMAALARRRGSKELI